ncbi:hypothetical protein K3495_g5208 [Podosphaera aphanis]|nr:hypothetical protein K3495_g5208 [Podosphaera aphanis]
MADPLYDILLPYSDTSPAAQSRPLVKDQTTNEYLSRLTSLPLSSLTTTEPQSLSQTTHSLTLSLQGLSKRSYPSIISSLTHLSALRTALPSLTKLTGHLRDNLPKLDDTVIHFSENFNTRSENELLNRRRKALLLSRNVDKLSSILELPTLLSSAISSSNLTTSTSLNFSSALDLYAHIRRLYKLYPESSLIIDVEMQSEEAIQELTTCLIASLKTNSLKLASAMRTISWLRRIIPSLDSSPGSTEGALASVFLVCRLANLQQMLGALEPLKDLADQEALRLIEATDTKGTRDGGLQTERYLKRYIEIFREQSFAIISMYRSIFQPSSTAETRRLVSPSHAEIEEGKCDTLQPIPSILTTFPSHLVSMLMETLRIYLPNVKECTSRDSLLTQVLFCASSLGRLGGDFSMILALLDITNTEDHKDNDDEWVEITRKHRMLAGRLESIVGNRDTQINKMS